MVRALSATAASPLDRTPAWTVPADGPLRPPDVHRPDRSWPGALRQGPASPSRIGRASSASGAIPWSVKRTSWPRRRRKARARGSLDEPFVAPQLTNTRRGGRRGSPLRRSSTKSAIFAEQGIAVPQQPPVEDERAGEQDEPAVDLRMVPGGRQGRDGAEARPYQHEVGTVLARGERARRRADPRSGSPGASGRPWYSAVRSVACVTATTGGNRRGGRWPRTVASLGVGETSPSWMISSGCAVLEAVKVDAYSAPCRSRLRRSVPRTLALLLDRLPSPGGGTLVGQRRVEGPGRRPRGARATSSLYSMERPRRQTQVAEDGCSGRTDT